MGTGLAAATAHSRFPVQQQLQDDNERSRDGNVGGVAALKFPARPLARVRRAASSRGKWDAYTPAFLCG